MNKKVYHHLLSTYGRRPAIWFGLAAELTRSLLMRVVTPLLLANTAINLAAGDTEGAKQNIFAFLLVYVIGAIIGAVGELTSLRSENAQYEKLSVGYYLKLTGKDMSFYRNNHGGYLVSLFRQYLDGSLELVRFFRGEVARTIVSLIAPAVVLLWVSVPLGLVAIAIIIVQLMYIAWSSAKANKYRAASHEIYRKTTAEVADEITNITAFKSGGVEKQAHSKMAGLAREETIAFQLRRETLIKFDLPRDLITAVGVFVALLVVVSSATNSPQSIGLVLLALTYMMQIIRSVGDLPNIMTRHDDLITKTYPPLTYLGDEFETIQDPAEPKKLVVTHGAIAFNNVDFSYPSRGGQNVPVFKNLSIDIKGGEHVGIVGLSGAGKSTLASLIMRFDDVTGGSITVDGTSIRDVAQSDLRKKIAYVPQEPLLFHRSIRENIAYFNDNASDADIIAAAKAAHAHDFITELPDGYHTAVGERGIKLSGGQKQRIVIARAILKNAPIMLFDEATSALDSESEKIIQQAMPKIIGAHTAIVIAHRLSTVAGLDRILVMHKGEIIESGTHDELLKLSGRYHSLWQKQVAHSSTV